MTHCVQEELLILHTDLLKKYEALKFDVHIFLESSKELLDKSILAKEETCQSVLKEYKDYIFTLFNMLSKTTDFVYDMMLAAQNIKSINFLNENLLPAESLENLRDMTLTPSNQALDDEETFPFIQKDENLDEFVVVNIENLSKSVPKKPELPCGTVDTTIYEEGTLIHSAFVCSIETNSPFFCICNYNNPEYKLLVELFNRNKHRTYTFYPEPGVIFGIKLEDGVVRGIRCSPDSMEQVYLLDYGDFISLDKNLNNIMYLTEAEQNISAQAIQCQLYYEKSFDETFKHQYQILKGLLYQRADFMIHKNQNGVLHLSVIKKQNTEVINVQNKKDDESSYTEDWKMLYEETTSTSNPLKAVLGYIPKDEQRICRFFDPKTGACFKGNSCKQLHIAMPNDYYTKDLKPVNAFVEKSLKYKPNTELTALITHVKNFEYFYGVIVDESNPTEPMMWDTDDILKNEYLTELPFRYDIVLAQFTDNNWYRAQIEDVDYDTNETVVFYIDYGNRQVVPLERLAKCPNSVIQLPGQAEQFRLSNVYSVAQDREVMQRGMNMLKNMLLNNLVKMSVVSQFEDIVVELLDEPYCDIPKSLEKMHCIKIIDMLAINDCDS